MQLQNLSLKTMFSKSFFRFFLKTCIGFTGLGIATSFLPISTNSARAALGSIPDCPNEGSAAAAGAMSQDCYQTPEVMEVKFYELGFCTTSDPLAGSDFSRTNCEKAWDSSSGVTLDLASFTYQGLTSGLTYKVPNQTYEYAYVVVGTTWGIKGKAFFNGGTYYTQADGYGGTNSDLYDKADLTAESLMGGSGCWDFSESTDYGPVKAYLTDADLNTATNTSTCSSSTRLVGSIDLDTPLVMTSDVKKYRLTWIIRKMGMFVDWDSGIHPSGFGTGPFVPEFTLSN